MINTTHFYAAPKKLIKFNLSSLDSRIIELELEAYRARDEATINAVMVILKALCGFLGFLFGYVD